MNKEKLVHNLELLSNLALEKPNKQTFAIGRIDGMSMMASIYGDAVLSSYIGSLKTSIVNRMDILVKENMERIKKYLYN